MEVLIFKAFSTWRSSSLRPSRHGGLHLRAFSVWRPSSSRSSSLSLLGVEVFVFKAFSQRRAKILHVPELQVLRYAPLAPLGRCL